MIYLYQSAKFSNSCLVHALNENGNLEGVFEFPYPKKALEVLSKWKGFEDLELIDKPSRARGRVNEIKGTKLMPHLCF
jgi:hypothetical protein